MFAGCSEAAGPVDIDCSNPELVPSAGSDVGQLDALLCGLKDRWGKENHRGQGSRRVKAPCEFCCHISHLCVSLCQTFKDTVTVRNVQPRATVCQRRAALSQL